MAAEGGWFPLVWDGLREEARTVTVAAIKQAFRRMESAEQATLLKDLVASLAESLALAEARDSQVFAKRATEEPRARSWDRLRTDLLKKARRSRARRR